MPRRRKQFPCGHQGYGQVCHRCAQAEGQKEKLKQEQEIARQLRRNWEASFERDPIDLRSLPKPMVSKARDIIQALGEGVDYRQFKGKRLNHDRHVISIPLNYDYRLLCQDVDNRIEPKAVLSHEDYNVKKPKA
ncbi:hypothetical protein L3556_04125 [Candidatus Synechococcus calcipolaris G9]|uniref:Uncharacterized protein n=1 Tax=Candidatus Synechococcus calcipolaris G9 TaxID=1497997 RepID=A0ABT6EYS1_9SYNE|nr:hypothetical protein [Candidatus Synechococcus calcipolaris]MDG2990125.1 hypothetical protein [Candidatus Synechococcus calcipolaris G9]